LVNTPVLCAKLHYLDLLWIYNKFTTNRKLYNKLYNKSATLNTQQVVYLLYN